MLDKIIIIPYTLVKISTGKILNFVLLIKILNFVARSARKFWPVILIKFRRLEKKQLELLFNFRQLRTAADLRRSISRSNGVLM